ncbi:hypothetical protein ALI22I_43470 [Saccharothrix sp. ALI-22-I]|nr:hypothetical protein ALI22I_43470 [Saccharothrix sp. ALI-22-I]
MVGCLAWLGPSLRAGVAEVITVVDGTAAEIEAFVDHFRSGKRPLARPAAVSSTCGCSCIADTCHG